MCFFTVMIGLESPILLKYTLGKYFKPEDWKSAEVSSHEIIVFIRSLLVRHITTILLCSPLTKSNYQESDRTCEHIRRSLRTVYRFMQCLLSTTQKECRDFHFMSFRSDNRRIKIHIMNHMDLNVRICSVSRNTLS